MAIATSRVLLVSMPFSLPYYPSMALGLLKPAAEAAGFGCDVRYFSLDHVVSIGDLANAHLTDVRILKAQIGDWVFAAAANGLPSDWGLDHVTDRFARDFPELYHPERLMAFLEARAGAEGFIEDCYRSVDWSRYGVVGFTSSFQQNLATLAMARRVKRDHPDLFIVIGGANCQDEMGAELHRQYPFLDAVCQGEGDRAFPELLLRLAEGRELTGIPGMVVRAAGGTVVPVRSTDPVEDLDTLPVPDFDDFFAQHAAHDLGARHPTAVVWETARGCWWGAKHHCTFCGLNGVTMSYRSKSQERAFEELEYLVRRHGTRDVANADNIIDMRYFERFVPRLAASGLDLLIYYEAKSNLKPWHWALLGRAGIRKVQAGIEALDTGLLKLMKKGVTGLQNVAALKLAAEAGVYVEWLFLHGFPGEDPDSYAATAALIPRLRHLQPPAAFIRVRADRFSPYFHRPEEFGITLEPLDVVQALYPFDSAATRRLAYHFTMRSSQLDDSLMDYTGSTDEQSTLWRRHHEESALWVERDGAALVVEDRRWGWESRSVRLEGAAAFLLDQAWQPVSWRQILGAGRFGEGVLRAAATGLEMAGFLHSEGEMLLALPLRQPGFRRAPIWPEIRAGRIRPFAETGAMDQPLALAAD